MKETIVFTERDGDPFIYKEVDYNFSIGDYVYYELSLKEREEVGGFYPEYVCEGVISKKWIDIGEKKILCTVEIDF